MKKYIAFILLIQLTFGACDNDDKEASNRLSGRWKWRSTCGGFVGCRYPISAADQVIMTISSTSISTKQDNADGSSSTYEILNRTNQDDATIYQVKITSTGETWDITVNNDKLVMTNAVFTKTYSRIF
jgi:hypothetical protein